MPHKKPAIHKNILLVVALLLAQGGGGGALADSKAEQELRARLAIQEKQLADAAKERAALTLALAKLNQDAAKQAAATAASSTAASLRTAAATLASTKLVTGQAASAADVASKDAAVSQAIAENNGATAERAAMAASAAATGAAAASAAARAQNVALMITQSFGFLVVLTGFLYKAYTDTRDRRWAKQDLDNREKAALGRHDVVIEKLDEVKTEAHLAYNEANSVNSKLASIGVQMKDGKPLKPEA